MQVIFAGGASGVGASCLAIEIADQWIVVDAGVRVDKKADPLPDLALLEGKDVRAIFVTHAHADHIGALPLLHQAFPTVPIFASRATALLMEVMLADALKVMTRRAVEEMELPLYPETLVSSMLAQVRPLPVGEPFTLPILPSITISASRAGHIAGAVSLGFTASGGSIVVSGDISSTPQRTVLGAAPPPVERPDLLVLESTYGSRLHPNRQAEEQRLAQAVAGGLANGGHTLIPCFGLGRGQEILLILQEAQEKGQIPSFPIYVDGLVRRVCSTYLLLPEALTPRLQRQIRKGYLPFTGPNVSFVRDERDRERILAGPPACILSSSGMLTGGPSAWYAARLVSNPNASILITGYQDEESPGKRLLDLADHDPKSSYLEVNGQQVQVWCHFAKYSLSAHADGGELAAYATALRPRRVALVHGDDEARAALRTLLTETEVLLPTNGMVLETKLGRAKNRAAQAESPPLPILPTGIGKGRHFDYTHIEELWRAVAEVPTLRIVTARELALTWYGEATDEATESILDTFMEDYEQRYFVRQHALEEAYRVRGQFQETPEDFLSDLVGSVLLLLVSPESAKPAICRAIEPGAAVRVYLPRGISQERARFPFSSILEVLGPAPQEAQESTAKAGAYLNDLVKVSRRIRRHLSAHELARQCEEDTMYTLGELCEMAGLSSQSLEDRLSVAKILHKYPLLFTQSRTVFEGEGLTLYSLAPEWRETLEEPEVYERPDQNWILSVIEQYIDSPPDLYRRSVDPDTGAVTLAFHFPAVAYEKYADALAAAAEEAGVPITLAPHAHQGELVKAAYRHLPASLTVESTPSLYFDRWAVLLHCGGQARAEEIEQARAGFREETGWQLELEINGDIVLPGEDGYKDSGLSSSRLGGSLEHSDHSSDGLREGDQQGLHRASASTPALTMTFGTAMLPARASAPVDQHTAHQVAQRLLGGLPGFTKVGLDVASITLVPRFQFPDVAATRYAGVFEQLEAQTGWQVRLHPTTNQEALVEMARRVLPPELQCSGTPSLYLDQHAVGVHYTGSTSPEAMEEAQQQFLQETGWQLRLIAPGQKGQKAGKAGNTVPERMSQGQALALVREAFSSEPTFYRVGADTSKGILWAHFHFPELAKQRYAEQLASLSSQIGWKVYIYPIVHRLALIEAVRRLLPEGVSINGEPQLFQHNTTLSVDCAGAMSADLIAYVRQRFRDETGWELNVVAG
ncbi:MAG TPA: MBL fold metallo-hydrolase [Ktedonobacteraceae bacterium]|nr:MBL fold metallo-hydrolase [Ktedonobacteraceae bacterium]